MGLSFSNLFPLFGFGRLYLKDVIDQQRRRQRHEHDQGKGCRGHALDNLKYQVQLHGTYSVTQRTLFVDRSATKV